MLYCTTTLVQQHKEREAVYMPRPQNLNPNDLREARRPTVIPAVRNPGVFTGWGPKL